MSRKRPIEYKVIVVFLIALAALCGVCVGRHVYSHLHTQCIERQQNAQVEQRIEEAQKFLEEIERTGNLYHVFSRIAGTIDDGKVTNGYCKAWRMLGGNLMWPSPENHMLAAYWDQKDSERDGQFRSESAQYVASSWLTNGIQHVWANRDKLVVCVDSIVGNNTKIADELMRSKEVFTYYSVGMPKIDFAALANVVRCYWCARIVRHAERGRVRMAEGELKRMIELAALVVKGANTDEEIHLAVVMLRNAQVGSEANRRGRRADWSQTRRVCFGGMRSGRDTANERGRV